MLKAFAFVPLTIFFSNEKNERQEGKGSKDGILWSVARAFSVPGTRLVGTSWEAQGWKTPRGSWVWASRHTQPCSFGICTIPDGGIQLTSPNKPCQMGLHHPTSPAQLILVNEPTGQLLLGASSHPCLATANLSLKSFGTSLCSVKECGLSPQLAPKRNDRAV